MEENEKAEEENQSCLMEHKVYRIYLNIKTLECLANIWICDHIKSASTLNCS